MSEQLRLERNLPGLLEDVYVAGTPNYRNDVLAAVARTRQRPAWTFLERWLPMVDIAAPASFAGRLPMRAISLALLLLALIAAGLLIYAGSESNKIPAPFGPARNGGVVYAVDGDLYLGDPATGSSRAILTGPGLDRKPVVSPDGRRIAFLRGEDGSTEDGAFDLMVGTVGGSDVKVISTQKLGDGDPFAWSPDSRFLLATVGEDGTYRYDADGGSAELVSADVYVHVDSFRPTAGSQVLYEPLDVRSLGVMNLDGSGSRIIYTIPPVERQDGCDYASVIWSPDGQKVAFLRHPVGTESQCRIFVMNADGTDARQLTTDAGLWTETDLRWSPDGSQIAFNRWEFVSGTWLVRPIGLVSASGGAARSVGPAPVSDGAAFTWAPDGGSIIYAQATVIQWPTSTTLSDMIKRPVMIDLASGASREVPWAVNSWPTWQRLAP